MNLADVGGIAALVRRARNDCEGVAIALSEWLKQNPQIDPTEAAGIALLSGRAPFPSIDGNPPVDRSRPYLDLRRLGNE